jgi:Tfp pilus assembly protein PilX
MTTSNVARNRGAALVVGLIMLVLITLMLITALNLGTVNFRSVSNMQFREEAIAAANQAIDQVIGSPFVNNPSAVAAAPINVDMDKNGTIDYVVRIALPQCVYAAQAFGADPSSLSLPASMTVASTWNTVWDIQATVDSANNVGGAAVVIRAGVRVLLDQVQKDAKCP